MSSTQKHVRLLAQRIAEKFKPEKIILFGSHAYGDPRPDSDIDLLVILPFEGKNFRKSLEIMNWIDERIPLDLLARKPDDVTNRYRKGDP